MGLDISHTYDADLDVTLIAPNGTRVELFTDVGGGGANFVGTILDDEASTAIQSAERAFHRAVSARRAAVGFGRAGHSRNLDVGNHGRRGHRHWNAQRLGAHHQPGGRHSAANSRRGSIAQRSWTDVAQIDVLSVQFSEAMQPATVNAAANWELREAGADEAFDTPDDVLIRLATSPAYAGGIDRGACHRAADHCRRGVIVSRRRLAYWT